MRFIFIALLFVQGCAGTASMPEPIEVAGYPKIGMSKPEVDHYFMSRNNETGYWRGMMVGARDAERGEETIFHYDWVRNKGYSLRKVGTWEFIFVNDKLISFKVFMPKEQHTTIINTPKQQGNNPGISQDCKDALASKDQGRIFVSCQ